MHSDPEAIKKSIRTYLIVGALLFVGTVITVAVNQVHLAVPLAITVALIIACTKGSLVASVFMHLNHERKWIYGALVLTVIGFFILLLLPLAAYPGRDWDADGVGSRGCGARGTLAMSLRAFHLFFIGVSIVLAAFCAAWAVGQYRELHQAVFIVTAAGSVAGICALAVYGTAFQRKTRNL